MDVIRCNLTGLDYRLITRVHAKLSNNRKYGWFVFILSRERVIEEEEEEEISGEVNS